MCKIKQNYIEHATFRIPRISTITLIPSTSGEQVQTTIKNTKIYKNKRMTPRSREAKNALKTLDLERLSQLMHKIGISS